MASIHSPHIIALCGWFVGWILLWRFPRLEHPTATTPEDSDKPADLPEVTVIIPARNEATRIGALLDSLAAHRPPNIRVLVVDDHSDDGTAEVAGAYPFVEVVSAPDLPDDWLGKPWASHSGVLHARPGVLAFLDADIWLHPDGLDHALEAWRQHGGLISVYPHHDIERPYEHLSVFFQIIAVMGVRSACLFPGRRATGAIGTMLLTSTDDYELTGGYPAVRHDVIEDFALAKLYGSHDRSVRVYGGHEDVSVRLYGDGIRGLVQGWVKTLARGAHTIPFVLLAGVVFWMTSAIGGLTWVHGPLRWESGVLYTLFSAQIYVMARQIGRYSVLTALAYPLLSAFLVVLLVASVFKTFFQRKLTWRGRTIDLKASTPKSE